MIININKLLDKLIWMITVILFASIFVFETYTWGKYIFLIGSILILVLSVLQTEGRLLVTITPWHGLVAGVMCFSLFSSLWALSSDDALQKAFTLGQILMCLAFVHVYYQRRESVWPLISAIKWAGYLVAIYSFVFYGYENVIEMLDNAVRLSNEFSNVNSIGMLSAMAIVIQTYEIVCYRKLSWAVLPCIPSLVMVAATQSRKAFLLAVLGIILVLLINSFGSRDVIRGALKILGAIVLASVIIYMVMTLPIFEGVTNRMDDIWAMITGEGSVGASAHIRVQMMELGWASFLKNPIGGVGFGCPHILAAKYLSYDAYLHNNFVEVLAGGGVIGFFVYYWGYIYLIVNLFKYRKTKNKEYWLCAILIVLLLIMDYGQVSCYSKHTYFYFMVFYLEIACLKRQERCMADEPEQDLLAG